MRQLGPPILCLRPITKVTITEVRYRLISACTFSTEIIIDISSQGIGLNVVVYNRATNAVSCNQCKAPLSSLSVCKNADQ